MMTYRPPLFGAVALLAASLVPVATEAADAPATDFTAIFNGKDLTGWDGDPAVWSVKDGVIVGETSASTPLSHNTFLILKRGMTDFELHASFRIESGNSGIQFRSKDLGDHVVSGYQADFSADGQWTGTLYEEKGRGVLAKPGTQVVIAADGTKTEQPLVVGANNVKDVVKVKDWNSLVVVARGGHITESINGVPAYDVIDREAAKRALRGIMALQLHAGPPMKVQFKSLLLKTLKPGTGTTADENDPYDQSKVPIEADLNNKKHTKIVLVAGSISHGPGEHEFFAGCALLMKLLQETPNVDVVMARNNWPQNEAIFDNAKTIVFFLDGRATHPLAKPEHMAVLKKYMDKGVGLVNLHYAVDYLPDVGATVINWLGGFYEVGMSINPHWLAEIKSLPNHPITRGVKPFTLQDEWYFDMHFQPNMKGVTPLLKAIPPDDRRTTPDTKAHPGREEIMSWAYDRPKGARAFGFTGGHFHNNFGDENFRRLVVNGILWTAKVNIPKTGARVDLDPGDLQKNLDAKK